MAPDPSRPGNKPSEITKKRKDPPQNSAKNNSSSNNNSRFHKRAKVYDARTLRSQPADAALKNGELDLQAFLGAREREIQALTDGMRASKAVNNRRAFQLVPRGLRRRTASHNVKKLPKRLRARARREQIDDNTPTVEARRRVPKTAKGRIRVERARALGILAEKKRKRRLREAKERAKEGDEGKGKEEVSAAVKQLIDTRPKRPKIRRNMLNNPLAPKSKFRKRQINKTWLPTHLWHAKRSKMTPPKEPLWRFAIPLTPNEKIYRPTHRAFTVKGALVWDMSYMSTIGMYGHEAGIERTLRTLGLVHDSLWDDRGMKWREGRRKWSGMLSKQHGDVRRQIGPATILWNPQAKTSDGSEPAISTKIQRQVYIRVHPSCFLEVFEILVKLIKRESPRLYVEDLRFEIGSIDLTGPGALEALLGFIRPYHKKEDSKEVGARLFESMAVTSILPPDTILGFSAEDPRLCYPPRTVHTKETSTVQPVSSEDTTLSPFAIFDRNARYKASLSPSQKALNRRKAAHAPGKPLEVTSADPAFPLILISSRTKLTTGTWTLLAPWKCILPIWYSLVHYPLSSGGNPRVGGLDELRQVTFEQGLPWFPGDFPGTDAGAEWELEMRQKRQIQWAKRPKSKRVTWESLDLGAGRKGEIGAGWACEFERLFALKETPEPEPIPSEGPSAEMEKAVDDDTEGGAPMTDTQAAEDISKKLFKEAALHPLTLTHHLSKAAFNSMAACKATNTPSIPPNALVTIKILFPGRGVVEPCARIYRLPSRSSTNNLPSSTELEVPATHPPPQTKMPSNLRDQWVAKLPDSNSTKKSSTLNSNASSAVRFPVNADHDTQKLHLARSLLFDKVPFPPPSKKECVENGEHPLVPSEEDLIGYVTKGEFSLAEGKGVAIGCISVERALEALRVGGKKEGMVCVVRNAGETIGWVGRWEAV